MKIGIYGGAFNPVHLSHMEIVKKLLKNHYLDKIIVVPVGDFYQKANLISFKHRYNMLKLLFNTNDVVISDFENQDKQIYTYQTLDYFKNIYPKDEIYFITGIDNIKEIKTWKNYSYILDNYKIIVIPRGKVKKLFSHSNIIYTNIKVKAISSSEIRNNLNSRYLDKKIISYIKENNLYKK